MPPTASPTGRLSITGRMRQCVYHDKSRIRQSSTAGSRSAISAPPRPQESVEWSVAKRIPGFREEPATKALAGPGLSSALSATLSLAALLARAPRPLSGQTRDTRSSPDSVPPAASRTSSSLAPSAMADPAASPNPTTRRGLSILLIPSRGSNAATVATLLRRLAALRNCPDTAAQRKVRIGRPELRRRSQAAAALRFRAGGRVREALPSRAERPSPRKTATSACRKRAPCRHARARSFARSSPLASRTRPGNLYEPKTIGFGFSKGIRSPGEAPLAASGLQARPASGRNHRRRSPRSSPSRRPTKPSAPGHAGPLPPSGRPRYSIPQVCRGSRPRVPHGRQS